MSRFKQITFELHGLTDNSTHLDKILELLRKLNKTHQLIHLHPCNCGLSYVSWGNKKWFNVLEASYASRECYSFDDDYDVELPLSINLPCSDEWPEVGLCRWNDPVEFGDTMTSVISTH